MLPPFAAGTGLDPTTLCVVPGKACWVVYVDALVLNEGGNVLGALSLAVRAALAATRIPKVRAAVCI
jgi:exosome complex component RRP42